MGVVLLLATLLKQCGSISQKREKDKPSAGLLFKGLFFFVKILKIKAGYTRMYPAYKNAYKRPFYPNKKALKGEKMKKLLIGLCFLCASTPSMAAGANKMTMVTYFPVKYVAYSQVDVMKQMDVGLTSACQMNLGCSADEGFNTGKSLRVNNLLKIAGGKLELNDAPAIEGSTAHIGSGNGTADFDFKTSLRVGNYKQGYTLQADNMYLSELNLFGYKFPACSGETMSWQKLKLKNKEEVYLVCGEAEQGETGCANPPVSTTKSTMCSKVYGSGYSGNIWYKWNEDTCTWDKASENCTRDRTRYLSYPTRCLRYCVHKTEDGSIEKVSKCDWPRKDYNFAHCSVDVLALKQMGVIPDILDCKPGTECAICIPGKEYIVENLDDYCSSLSRDRPFGNSTFHSRKVVQCYEGTKPPQPGNLNCANVNPGQGGYVGDDDTTHPSN